MKNGQYTLIKAPKDYPGKKYRGKYAYEHILVWWENTKIVPPNGYDIHHKNKNKRDNRFENLEMIERSTHSKLHQNEKEKNVTFLICPYCKKIYSRLTKDYKSQIGKTKNFHCSRSCSVKNQHLLRLNSAVE